MKGRGFTLAEVLITLGVVGLIAAMTIPSLIAYYKAKVMETQFKRAYSVLSNATKLIVAQGISPYSLTASERVNEYSKVLDASYLSNSRSGWKNLTGKNNAHIGPLVQSQTIVLKDGTVVLIGRHDNNWIYIDINGLNAPNILGYDLHVFKIMSNNYIEPVTHPAHDTRECTLKNLNSTDIYLGYGCTEYALLNKNPDGAGNYWYDFLNQK